MPRHSLEVFDRLIERAFAPREMPIVSPVAEERSPSPELPQTPLDMPDEELAEPEVEASPAQQDSLHTVWEAVQSAKERVLEGSPSKVPSLEGVVLPPASALPRKKVARKRSSVSFKESPDRRNMIVTFDMTGVKKPDMHVSFRTTRLIVSWKVERIMEKREGGTMMRDREVRKYSHTIPLADGTKFEEVRASRDGPRLMLTIPNTKCLRADTEVEYAATPAAKAEAPSEPAEDAGVPNEDEEDEEEPTNLRTIPDFETALSGVSEYHSCVATGVV
ncbi:uncharacterized protein TRAVEDRAFT_48510 [Trametes versicolor FP-101664 SS1]|uniref:uncharacterized protein n=1 Tax=Trametes versicolor (strain FP-101664) TaxID=717944 RepID=UPI00046217D8|nr:uncharacterized protein TRAVEDRAFT_48510 [Trametes versicolor FP-101664 SS1]EIW57471.1 hypothetical protein TRAVEDRAFT_48510 [Trametes versicolor FP-101664 SS1]